MFSPLESKVHRYQRSVLLRWPSYCLHWRVKCTDIRGQYCIESLCDDQLFSRDTVALLLGLFNVSGLWRGTSRDWVRGGGGRGGVNIAVWQPELFFCAELWALGYHEWPVSTVQLVFVWPLPLEMKVTWLNRTHLPPAVSLKYVGVRSSYSVLILTLWVLHLQQHWTRLQCFEQVIQCWVVKTRLQCFEQVIQCWVVKTRLQCFEQVIQCWVVKTRLQCFQQVIQCWVVKTRLQCFEQVIQCWVVKTRLQCFEQVIQCWVVKTRLQCFEQVIQCWVVKTRLQCFEQVIQCWVVKTRPQRVDQMIQGFIWL